MFTKSQRKHIRKEKARIRREFFDLKKQEEEIQNLYEKVLGKPKVAEIKEQGKIKEEKPGPAAPVVAPAAGVKQRPKAQEKNEDK